MNIEEIRKIRDMFVNPANTPERWREHPDSVQMQAEFLVDKKLREVFRLAEIGFGYEILKREEQKVVDRTAGPTA